LGLARRFLELGLRARCLQRERARHHGGCRSSAASRCSPCCRAEAVFVASLLGEAPREHAVQLACIGSSFVSASSSAEPTKLGLESAAPLERGRGNRLLDGSASSWSPRPARGLRDCFFARAIDRDQLVHQCARPHESVVCERAPQIDQVVAPFIPEEAASMVTMSGSSGRLDTP
jgi:hypothetical protein